MSPVELMSSHNRFDGQALRVDANEKHKCEQTDGPNPYAFGTSVMPPASASRAGATPEASRDRSSGTFARKYMTSFLTQLSRPPATGIMSNAKWKYGLLAFLLLNLGFQIWFVATLPATYSGSHYTGLFVGTSLLLNHLMFYFWFGPKAAVFLRLFALVFAFATLGFVIYSMT
jgi:hypothetical protein